MSRQYPAETRRRAHQLYNDGAEVALISCILSVPHGTVARWVIPGRAEKDRAQSRAYKERNRGTCETCGKPTWIGSKQCAACSPKHNKRWTRETIIIAIQQWAEKHGRPPLATEWHRADETHPAPGTVYQRRFGYFKSWADAIEAAGFPRPKVGHKVVSHKEEYERIIRLRSQGKAVTDIAKIMQMPPSTVQRYLGREKRNRAKNNNRNLKKRTREQRIADLKKALENQ